MLYRVGAAAEFFDRGRAVGAHHFVCSQAAPDFNRLRIFPFVERQVDDSCGVTFSADVDLDFSA